MTLAQEGDAPSKVLRLLDQAVAAQTPLARGYVDRLRRQRPTASPTQLLRRLNADFRAATIAAGAGVGGAAAAPGVGSAAALVLSGGEAAALLNGAALYVLARAEVHGVRLDELSHRRTLVMAVMLGDAGTASVQRVAERTGRHWAKQAIANIPQAKINAVNRVLGRHFVTKYGTKQGILVLGKVVPFGIGAVIGATMNATMSQSIITAADRAFGPVPDAWEPGDAIGGERRAAT